MSNTLPAPLDDAAASELLLSYGVPAYDPDNPIPSLRGMITVLDAKIAEIATVIAAGHAHLSEPNLPEAEERQIREDVASQEKLRNAMSADCENMRYAVRNYEAGNVESLFAADDADAARSREAKEKQMRKLTNEIMRAISRLGTDRGHAHMDVMIFDNFDTNAITQGAFRAAVVPRANATLGLARYQGGEAGSEIDALESLKAEVLRSWLEVVCQRAKAVG